MKEVEDLARKKVAQEYHMRTVNTLEQQLAAARKVAGSQKTALEAQVATLSDQLKEKTARVTELETLLKQVR